MIFSFQWFLALIPLFSLIAIVKYQHNQRRVEALLRKRERIHDFGTRMIYFIINYSQIKKSTLHYKRNNPQLYIYGIEIVDQRRLDEIRNQLYAEMTNLYLEISPVDFPHTAKKINKIVSRVQDAIDFMLTKHDPTFEDENHFMSNIKECTDALTEIFISINNELTQKIHNQSIFNLLKNWYMLCRNNAIKRKITRKNIIKNEKCINNHNRQPRIVANTSIPINNNNDNISSSADDMTTIMKPIL